MYPADNFNPEWGYLAPAPGFVRTLKIAAVAAAIGLCAGAATVLSLSGRPAADESVAARTLVKSMAVATPVGLPRNAEAEATAMPTAQHQTSAAVLAESPSVPADEPARVPLATAPKAMTASNAAIKSSKSPSKKHRSLAWWHAPRRDESGRTPLVLVPSYGGRATLGANWPNDPTDDY